MFKKWFNENNSADIDFSSRLFPESTDRCFWNRVLDNNHIFEAEKYLGYEWPIIRATQFMEFQKSGNRLSQEEPHFARRNALLRLFIGELTEHKGRFLPDLCDGIFTICEETYWGLSAHSSIIRLTENIPDASVPYIDLFAAETAELISLIYHIMYNDLENFCPEILSRIEYELDRRIVKPYISHGDFWWMGHTKGYSLNNWTPWILSNILNVFLVMDIRKTDFQFALNKMFCEMDDYYNTVADDGGCDEGAVYWGASAGKMFQFCDELYIATNGKINLFNDEKAKRMWLYEPTVYIGDDYCVNFSDGGPHALSGNWSYIFFVLGIRTGEKIFLEMAGTLERKRREANNYYPPSGGCRGILYSYIYTDKVDTALIFNPPEKNVLPILQNSFMRSGKWYYAAKGGLNAEQHNHNDVGNFIVYHDNKPLILDVGPGVYTRFTFSERRYEIWTMQSGYHNLPVINGCEQKNGAEYKADCFEVNGKKTKISFAGAYTNEAGIKKAEREIDINENGVSVFDKFEFCASDNTVSEHLLTILKPEKTDNGIAIGGKYLIKTDLECIIEYKSFENDAKLTESWNTDGVYRLIFRGKYKKTGSAFFGICEL